MIHRLFFRALRAFAARVHAYAFHRFFRAHDDATKDLYFTMMRRAAVVIAQREETIDRPAVRAPMKSEPVVKINARGSFGMGVWS